MNQITILNENILFDTAFIYHFLKKLITPFEKMKAYELGLIDERGNIIRSRSSLKTREEKRALTLFDVFIINLKKLIQRVPFGKTRLASFAAALFLLKEQNNCRKYQDIELLDESFSKFMEDCFIQRPFYEAYETIHFISIQEAKKIGEDINMDWDLMNPTSFRDALEYQFKSGSFDLQDSALIILRKLQLGESVPTNSVGSGGLAMYDPVLTMKNKKRKTFGKYFTEVE